MTSQASLVAGDAGLVRSAPALEAALTLVALAASHGWYSALYDPEQAQMVAHLAPRALRQMEVYSQISSESTCRMVHGPLDTERTALADLPVGPIRQDMVQDLVGLGRHELPGQLRLLKCRVSDTDGYQVDLMAATMVSARFRGVRSAS